MLNKLSRFIELNVSEVELPTEIKLFDVGENETSKGTFIYDPSVSLKHPNGWDKLAFDIDHLSFQNDTTPELRSAYGWFKLKADETGVWATEIEWSERIKPILQNKGFRFVSPAFNTISKESNVIGEIINVALTNIPATLNMTPIINSENINKDKQMSNANKELQDEEIEVELPEDGEEEKSEVEMELEAKLSEANTKIAD
jgi:phage I-like protein